MKSESTQWMVGFLLTILTQWSLHGVDGGWIDEDTPDDKRVVQSFIDGTDYDLVSFLVLHLLNGGLFMFVST